MKIREARATDAEAIIGILEGIAREQVYTAISEPWSAAEQRRYMEALSPREAIHIAETEEAGVVGYQVLDLWAPTLASMAHVGQIGTFLRPEFRGQGIGEALFCTTLAFAREHGFLKFAIQVRASNVSAQRFYRKLGFCVCGCLKRQVRIGDREDDELLLEFFL